MDFLKSKKLWLITFPNFSLYYWLLELMRVNDWTVKDSFSFAKGVVNFNESFYGKSRCWIFVDQTIKNSVDDLFSNNMYQGKLSKTNLYCLLKLATSESSFIFHNILYKQIDGVSMGSPLRPTLANVFLCHYRKL